jgi:copper resistance protein D
MGYETIIALSGLRLLQFASTLALFGSGLFCLYGYRSTRLQATWAASSQHLWTRPLLLAAATGGIASGIGWLLTEAIVLTGTYRSWVDVVTGTRFGQVLCVRVGLMVLCLALCAAMQPAPVLFLLLSVLAGFATASFAWTGHGSLDAGTAATAHLAADVLHLLSAAVWIGALLMLTLLLLRALKVTSVDDAREIAAALARFSVFGPLVVSVLLASGLVNSWFLVGPNHWSAVLESAYGLLLMAKIALFAVMLLLAVRHRYRAVPLLEQAIVEQRPFGVTLRSLRTTIATEALLALLVLAAVAVLGMLEPPVVVRAGL